ncbi:sugar ABC transporter permease [Candidatus Aerophobetes bacterium]|nr:sugar ABC transporter permease [Candidatus Aerophobetes bacterium]
MKKIAGKESQKRKSRLAKIFMSPAILIQFFFGWLPIGMAFAVCLFHYHILKPEEYVGLANFQDLFADPLTFQVFKNTFIYTGMRLAIFLLPVVVSILLMEMNKSTIRIMMYLWFFPIASTASIVIWKWMYNTEYGLLNSILMSLGLPTLRWLNDPRLVIFCLILPGILMYGPGLIYLATLQSIPDELYEAAELEGAGFWSKVWHITLPRMRPVLAMMLLLSIIESMSVFSQPWILTHGGPNNASMMVVMRIVDLAIYSMRYGKGTALAIILFAILMVIIIIQRKYFKEDIDR